MSVSSRRFAWFAAAALALPLLAIPATRPAPAAAATTFVVDTIVDLGSLDACTTAPGDCSLRGAIAAANASPGADTVHFDIPSGDCPGGVCRISLAYGGFTITEAVDLDATTQPRHGSPQANVCATATEQSHMRVEVVVDAGLNGTPFRINHAAGSSRVRGFALGTALPSAGSGVSAVSGSGHHIACNHIGLDAAGAASFGLGGFAHGVSVSGLAGGVVIGIDGDGIEDIAERNVFGPDLFHSIYIESVDDNVVAGNFFGFGADGETTLGSDDIYVRSDCDGTRIGTNQDGISDEWEGNHLIGEAMIRVGSLHYDPSDTSIVGNVFGMSPTGVPAPSDTGISVSGVPASTTGFEIRDNTFGWVEDGIVAEATGGEVLISGNTFGGEANGTPYGSIVALRLGGSSSYEVRDNLIRNSELLGIAVEDTAVTAAGSRDNCLVGNYFGLTNFTGANIVFENNWWGDPSGPSMGGSGIGDPISVSVDFEPWLTSPPAQCNAAPVASDANFAVSEDAAVGTVVGTVVATDDWDTLEYAITAGNWGGGFAIDNSGKITVAKELDYETTPAYVLTVEVSDPFRSDTASVAIVVTDVDEPEPEPTFRDVPLTHTFFGDVEWLAASGITLGCNPPTNDLFCPDGSVTRGQMAAFLHRALGDVLTPGSPVEFVDDDDSVFELDIEWLGAVGVTRGCNPPTNDMFCPQSAVTRGQMAAFLVRALELPAANGVDFVDDDGSVFEEDIERLAAAGITRGCNPPTNDRFCPDDPVKRSQMAAFLHRALTAGS
jgi:hypothetical protein